MPKRYRKLRGDTAYYPFAARTGLRARQRRHVRVLRGAGLAALALAAVLLVRQTVFRGGQPDAPAASAHRPGSHGPARPHPCDRCSRWPRRGTPWPTPSAADASRPRHARDRSSRLPQTAGEILPRYRALYEEKPRPHRLAAHRRDGHRPARRADARRQRILPAPRL